MDAMKRQGLRLFLSLAVIASMLGVAIAPQAAAADISGTTYTSPQFKFTVTWDANWFVVEEVNEEVDRVVITDGTAYLTVLGGEGYAGIAPLAVAQFFGSAKRDTDRTNVQIKTDAAGNPMRGEEGTTRAWLYYTYTLTFDDGSTMEVTNYLEARTLIPGKAILIIIGELPSDVFDYEWPIVQGVIDTVTIPGQATTSTGGTTTQPAEPLAGEPAPVFQTGPWRVAVRTAAEDATFPDLRLKEKSGKEWLVVVADVTNWSVAPATFTPKEFFARPGADADPVKLAPSSTASVAKTLKLEPAGGDPVEFKADETKRVVLVFLIPARSRETALVRETDALPLADALEISLDPAKLPQAAVPPKVELGTLVSASDGKTVRVQLEGQTKSTRIRLLGVEPPAEGECYEKDAEKTLDGLAGTQVLVETDSEVDDGSTPARYIWIVNPDGTRTLINEQLVADGLANAERLPVAARFGAWIAESERAAEAAGTGLWGGCETPKVPAQKSATPVASPGATPTR